MSHWITLTNAASMTSAFRSDKNTVLATSYQNQNIVPNCETFDRDELDDILAQTGCVGIRIYYGMDANLKVHAIIVGVNGDDEDMLTQQLEVPLIMQTGKRCPVDCPPTSALNS